MSSNLLGINFVTLGLCGLCLILFFVFLYIGFKHEDPADDDQAKEIEKTIISVMAWGFIVILARLIGVHLKNPFQKDKDGEA